MINFEKLREIKRESEKRAVSIGRAIVSVVENSGVTFCTTEALEKREGQCFRCIFKNGETCGHCGCYLPVKRKVVEFQCPLGIWNPELYENKERPILDEIGVVRAFFTKNKLVYAYGREQHKVFEYVSNPETMEIKTRIIQAEKFDTEKVE